MTHPSQGNSTLTAEQLAACAPIEQYFLGHAHDDASYMRQAFLPTAHIESMREGVFTSWPLDIDWIEVAGSAASARVTLVHGDITFTDYFVLLQTQDGWKIANKAFVGQPTQA